MTGYGLYALFAGLADLLGASRLEWQVNLALIFFGAMLVLAGLFVRVRLPGSLALSLAALFGLQSLALHNAAHLYGQIAPEPQIGRAVFAILLVALAYLGKTRDPDGQEAEDRSHESGGA
jgi:hypothetical protein